MGCYLFEIFLFILCETVMEEVNVYFTRSFIHKNFMSCGKFFSKGITSFFFKKKKKRLSQRNNKNNNL